MVGGRGRGGGSLDGVDSGGEGQGGGRGEGLVKGQGGRSESGEGSGSGGAKRCQGVQRGGKACKGGGVGVAWWGGMRDEGGGGGRGWKAKVLGEGGAGEVCLVAELVQLVRLCHLDTVGDAELFGADKLLEEPSHELLVPTKAL